MKVITKTYYMLDDEDRKSIKKQMIDLNLTLTQMADNLGVSKAYISSVINGSRHFTKKTENMLKSQGIVISRGKADE